MFKKYSIENLKSIWTLVAYEKVFCRDDGEEKVNKFFFRSIIRSLAFFTTKNLNIACLVSLISRYMNYKKHRKNPSPRSH